MKQGKKQQLATYEKLRETISAKISEVCLPGISSASHSGPTPLPDHGYALPAVQECVVYYLCGYIVHSFLKHVNCAACISSIQSTNTKFPASLLTLAREFRNGSLKHPSTELYTMLKRVEEKLSLVLGENHLCADMFWDALDVIKDCDVPSGKKCFVPRCTTGYKSCQEKYSLFSAAIDDERLKLWRHAIPRKDRPLQRTDSVCERHFESHLVTKTWTAHYNGNVLMSVPRRASLACDAVPTVFPDCPPYL
ncbi:hypothetical protein HPB51_015348 [Rhipicephalus microplus]|uniref:THAP-type domain-containing protein n=1 Tax=Rhipicephalus microplus TaxID=6941 RepID=A0A9J6DUX9_RHIMP|nr:hypothetical protein HPB51_015348 [Rhipicephalus microplus]